MAHEKDHVELPAVPVVIVRSKSAGVFLGELVSHVDQKVQLTNARRVWFWAGAASLSQLAAEGTKEPKSCKLAVPVDVLLDEVVEVLTVTEDAKKSLAKVKEWRA